MLDLSREAPLQICTAAGAPVEPLMLPTLSPMLLLEGPEPVDPTPGSDSPDLTAEPPPAEDSSPVGATGTQASLVSRSQMSVRNLMHDFFQVTQCQHRSRR